jgi:hypothetical protein
MLMLRHPVTFVALSMRHGNSYPKSNIERLHLAFEDKTSRVREFSQVTVCGKLSPTHSGHHHGDARMTVASVTEMHPAPKSKEFYPPRPGANLSPRP